MPNPPDRVPEAQRRRANTRGDRQAEASDSAPASARPLPAWAETGLTDSMERSGIGRGRAAARETPVLQSTDFPFRRRWLLFIREAVPAS
jgi:hypothetical protein